MAQRSTSGFWLSFSSFFILALHFRVSMGNERPRLAQSEAHFPKEPLALTDSQVDLKLLLNERRQSFAVPQMPRQIIVFRGEPEGHTYFLPLSSAQRPGTARTFAFFQSAKTFFLEPFHPILHSSEGVTQKPRHLQTSHTLSYQKNSMKTMIVASFMGAPYLCLERHDHCFCIRYD